MDVSQMLDLRQRCSDASDQQLEEWFNEAQMYEQFGNPDGDGLSGLAKDLEFSTPASGLLAAITEVYREIAVRCVIHGH